MEAHQLLKAGRLTDAIAALHSHLGGNPRDHKAQTFLFELICFTGDFEKAERQLHALIQDDHPHSESGIARYRGVLKAERARQRSFAEHHYPPPLVNGFAGAATGTLNGNPFLTISDADPRIGEKLELFVAGEYLWMSLSDVRRLQLPAPRRLRDLLWLPAEVAAVPSLQAFVLDDVWLPMMAPLTWRHHDEEVKLGRISDWQQDQHGEIAPFGIKTYLVDGLEIPLAEFRDLVLHPHLGQTPIVA